MVTSTVWCVYKMMSMPTRSFNALTAGEPSNTAKNINYSSGYVLSFIMASNILSLQPVSSFSSSNSQLYLLAGKCLICLQET